MRNRQEEVLSFWFVETAPIQWFQISPAFDDKVKDRFLDLFHFAQQGFCDDWEMSADGALALTLVFDQFPRILFRGTAEAYATDARALQIADAAIGRGFDQLFVPLKRRFLYLPFEHSEDRSHQDRSVALFATMKEDDPLGYDIALRRQQLIARFGRFPHRNKALGRPNTPDEAAYLEDQA